ncbi:hypothetical protein CEXT_57801 [Caerostris extrusa]|uniref:Uncharacterized protein n=1 Tax=Caerostris extrusa TaxID=172846 RepID=A0AAV4VFV2_CAEEX|nr:hypothetical protein CEXT_57801 [Caerostris extrusa]
MLDIKEFITAFQTENPSNKSFPPPTNSEKKRWIHEEEDILSICSFVPLPLKKAPEFHIPIHPLGRIPFASWTGAKIGGALISPHSTPPPTFNLSRTPGSAKLPWLLHQAMQSSSTQRGRHAPRV